MSHDPFPPYRRHPSGPPPYDPYFASPSPDVPPASRPPSSPYFPPSDPFFAPPSPGAPSASATYPTYPWQPEAQPGHAPRRTPVHAPLGHHSDLRVLRSAYRWQRRVATLTALGYFTLFLVLSAFTPGLMTAEAAGGLPAGLLLALAQLPVTWMAIVLYEHTARVRVDPLAAQIRRHAALDAKRGAAR
ncbi:DUF485 domain-containing protein [Streptomyces chromofuscus]|uniref:DUF485 domain-containing protein n=1 Tax=Streptomyces chromofuscus TaxID=42881 RepID=A0A7M2TEB8_STRCW|nr:DUF485 domain-containing protein [Streptomyces chromofuscus]QOV47087.1 DUF485 domain-containing protein [Streptomyces chromofuscus]GGT26247.1 hypothetical protein GCM10010254_53380 [Streptomyces chromofuscus]